MLALSIFTCRHTIVFAVQKRPGGAFQAKDDSVKKSTHVSMDALCWRYLFSHVGIRSSLPSRNAPVGRFRQRTIEKRPDLSDGTFLCWRYLFSHAVTRILSSTNLSLTSVFGMGTGGPSGQSTPTSSRQASYPSLPPTRFRVPSRARSFRCLSSPVQTRLRWALNGAHVFPGSWDPLRIVS